MTANSVRECRAALAVLLVGLAPSLVSLPPAAAQAYHELVQLLP